MQRQIIKKSLIRSGNFKKHLKFTIIQQDLWKLFNPEKTSLLEGNACFFKVDFGDLLMFCFKNHFSIQR